MMIFLMRTILILSALMMLAGCSNESHLRLPEIISDGMVLQQNSEVKFWGTALPGSRVRINTDWDLRVSATASLDSIWEVSVVTPRTDGQSHQVEISSSDTTIVINDILFGEVWFANGQSNMEMPLSGWANDTICGAHDVISKANDNLLRMFKVERQTSLSENCEVHGQWEKTTQQTAPQFSAVAYFYARMLRDSLNVPIGVVNASWGGTPCEAWTCSKQLGQERDFGEFIERMPQIKEKQEEYKNYLKNLPSTSLQNLFTDDFGFEYIAESESTFENWSTMELPTAWERTKLGQFDGVVWFVKKLNIPSSWVGHNLRLNLGAIDDCDMTFVNGIKIGEHILQNDYLTPRLYEIPARYIKGTELTIAVKVIDRGGLGGFTSYMIDNNALRLIKSNKEFIDLSGEWLYCVAGEISDSEVVKFDIMANTFPEATRPSEMPEQSMPTTLYNGMISPISRYKISGVIMYQGESNVGRAQQYLRLMKCYVDCIRNTFGNPSLPIIYTQIAPWTYGGGEGRKAAAANLREAQRRFATENENCYMISTLDLGSRATIHPSHKLEVGERLARAALNKVYGLDTFTAFGPQIKSISESSPLIIISFDNVKELRLLQSDRSCFEVAGDDGEFYSATVFAKGKELSLFSHIVAHPKYVRYAYADYVDAVLFNEVGLPAPSFSTYPSFDD